MLKLEFLNQPPDLGQFAFDGEWEKATAFQPGAFKDPAEAIAFIGKHEEVAFEAFFSRAFFGIRRKGSPDKLSQFVVNIAHALDESHSGF